ncbi:MAG: GNAT family N-acetyltransferase [Actinomycetota bacterium]|nr:GNAT family N-acetyltransferase [Actinomycetota bacterium]
MIRELERDDVGAVVRLALELNPHQVLTERGLLHELELPPLHERRRDWIAVEEGEVVGHAEAAFEWAVPTPGKGRVWISVAREYRGRGIGSELLEAAVAYLRAEGAWRVESYVPGDPAGARFLSRRGFRQSGRNHVSGLDLREALVPEVAVPGFRLATLGETRDRAHELHAICQEAELDMPSDEPETEVDFESWRRDEFDYPDISDEGSFVVLEGERPVSLVFLTVDPQRGVGCNSMTATLRSYRRRGLALFAKAAAARWSQETGLERLVTENDEGNVGMLAINDRLGYRPLYVEEYFVRLEGERPTGERG